MNQSELKNLNVLFIAPNPKDLDSYYRTLKNYTTSFISESSVVFEQVQNKKWQVIIIGDYLEANPLDYIQELKKVAQGDPSFILILKPGHEKLAIKAIQCGVQEYLFSDEMIPSIMHLIINKSVEQKKWQRVYENVNAKMAQPVTNVLLNQHFLELRLAEELKRSERYRFAVSFLAIDFIDLTIEQNKFGPAFVHSVFNHYGKIISKNLRSSDMIGLLNNDMLGIVLPHTDKNQSVQLWNRLEGIIKTQPMLYNNQNIFFNARGYISEVTIADSKLDHLIELIQNKTKNEDTSILLL